jgi:elongation factor P
VEGEVYKVLTADYHAGGGKMAGVAHAKLRNLSTGTIWERRFRADETLEEVELDRQTMQFLYRDDALSYFMNPESFEQVAGRTSAWGPSPAICSRRWHCRWSSMRAGR